MYFSVQFDPALTGLQKDFTRKELIDVRRLGFGIQYTLAELLLSEDKVTKALILQRLSVLRGSAKPTSSNGTERARKVVGPHEEVGPHVRDLVLTGKADPTRLRGREKELSAFVFLFLIS